MTPATTPVTTPVRTRLPLHHRAAAAVAAIGVAAAVIWGGAGLLAVLDRPAGFTRGSAPTGVTVEVTEPGTRVVYLEGPRGGPGGARPAIDGLAVIAPSGTTVPVPAYPRDLRYDVPDADGRIGTAVARFEAAATGGYRVTWRSAAGGPAGGSGRFEVAVGEDLAGGATRALLASVLLAAGVLVLAVLLVAFPAAATARRRGRAVAGQVARSI